MYKIFYKHVNETTEHLLYDPNDASRQILSGKLSLGAGKSGELEIEIPATNPEIENIVIPTDEFIVYRDTEVLFIGRPISHAHDFNNTSKITCEGILSYLCDQVLVPFMNWQSAGTIANILNSIIGNAGTFVDYYKRFRLGIVDAHFDGRAVIERTDEAEDALTMINEKIVKNYGGYLRARRVGQTNYLDYIYDYGTDATQDITIGINVLDVARNIEYSDIITQVLSANKVGDSYTFESYYSDRVDLLGKFNAWLDPTGLTHEQREAAAQLILDANDSEIESVEVKAIDLHNVDSSIQPFSIGDFVKCYIDDSGNFESFMVSQIDYDLLNPANDVVQLGVERKRSSIDELNAGYNFITMQNEINALKAAAQERVQDLLVPYTASGSSYTDSSHDWSKYKTFQLVMRIRSTATSTTWYFQTQNVAKGLLDGSFGGTSQAGRYNFNYYGSATSKFAGNMIIDFANQSISGGASGVAGWQNPDFALIGIY